MERLRAAEKAAKEKRACLYAGLPTPSATSKSNATTSNGQSRVFDATVIRVWSGDQISVVEKEGSKERRLQLSSTRGPKSVSVWSYWWLCLISCTLDCRTLSKHSMLRKPVNSCARSSLANTSKLPLTLFVPRRESLMRGNVLRFDMVDKMRWWFLNFCILVLMPCKEHRRAIGGEGFG